MELSQEPFPVLEILDKAMLAYELFRHPPIFTVEEGTRLLSHIPGRGSKNLFLRDKKGKEYFLVTVSEEKRVDLNALGEFFGVGRLSFGSPEKMRQFLSLEPGSVTILGLLYDTERQVRAFLDRDLYDAPQMQLHPMRNDGTIVTDPKLLHSFLEAQGFGVRVVQIPVIP